MVRAGVHGQFADDGPQRDLRDAFRLADLVEQGRGRIKMGGVGLWFHAEGD